MRSRDLATLSLPCTMYLGILPSPTSFRDFSTHNLNYHKILDHFTVWHADLFSHGDWQYSQSTQRLTEPLQSPANASSSTASTSIARRDVVHNVANRPRARNFEVSKPGAKQSCNITSTHSSHTGRTGKRKDPYTDFARVMAYPACRLPPRRRDRRYFYRQGSKRDEGANQKDSRRGN